MCGEDTLEDGGQRAQEEGAMAESRKMDKFAWGLRWKEDYSRHMHQQD